MLQVAGHHDMGGQQLPPNQGAHHGGVLRGVHEDGGARQEPPAVPVSLQSLAAEPQHPAGRQQVKHALRDAIEHEKKHALTRTDFQRAVALCTVGHARSEREPAVGDGGCPLQLADGGRLLGLHLTVPYDTMRKCACNTRHSEAIDSFFSID